MWLSGKSRLFLHLATQAEAQTGRAALGLSFVAGFESPARILRDSLPLLQPSIQEMADFCLDGIQFSDFDNDFDTICPKT